MILLVFNSMNIYLFWILFLALWAIVPLMIIKGRVDEEPKIQTSTKVKAKKKESSMEQCICVHVEQKLVTPHIRDRCKPFTL